MLDNVSRKVLWTCEKWQYDDKFNFVKGRGLVLPEERKLLGIPPDEIAIRRDNVALNDGLGEMIDLMLGLTANAYSAANAYMVVGDSNTAAAASQTDMQGTNVEKAMDGGFPSRSGQVATWKATYGSSDANFAWEEGGVKNGTGAVSATILMFNRKVTSLGTKGSGSTWTLTLDITFS